MIVLKNKNITLSELGEERTFVSGAKNWRLEWVDYEGHHFQKGTIVKWIDPDASGRDKRIYKGKIEYIIITERGDVDISIDDNTGLGRLSLDEVEFIKN